MNAEIARAFEVAFMKEELMGHTYKWLKEKGIYEEWKKDMTAKTGIKLP